jgi:ribosomal protein S18 acetylase RimI-like enzyme
LVVNRFAPGGYKSRSSFSALLGGLGTRDSNRCFSEGQQSSTNVVLLVMIRRAVPGDVKQGMPLILQAIADIAFVLSGTRDLPETESILGDFFTKRGNRLSYENCFVVEDEGNVVGIAILYNGADAYNLNLPVEQAAAKKSGNANYKIPIEPEESEFYLDAVGIHPRYHRRGYGSALIEAGCDYARQFGHSRFALLLDLDNASAKRLYDRLGFQADGTKWIAGKEYYHMVREL